MTVVLSLLVCSLGGLRLRLPELAGAGGGARGHHRDADRALRDHRHPDADRGEQPALDRALEGFTSGWLNTYQVQIVPFIADGLTIFLFVQYFKDLPRELIEAARVEGAAGSRSTARWSCRSPARSSPPRRS